jgi:arginase family enzyme
MNLNDYFDPIDINIEFKNYINVKDQLFSSVAINSVDHKINNIENYSLAIVGVTNYQSDNVIDSVKGLEKIREYLYSLSGFNKKINIYDLGNLKKGKTVNDNIIALRDVIVELISLSIIPVIIGSSEDIIYPNYLAYNKLDKKINFVSVDSKIGLSENRNEDFKSALWKVIVEENKSLFSFTNLGYQSHFVNTSISKYLTDQLHFLYRLGNIRSKIKDTEPIFRDADMIGINISAVRQSEAFGQINPSPNGLYGEEICQMAKYAGMSSKLTSFGIYDYCLKSDINNQTAHLIAQILWYFIEGYLNRIVEYPLENERDYKKYIVNPYSIDQKLVFYKSEKTERWWAEVPSFNSDINKQILIACTNDDYILASNGDVPERWLRFFQKIN